MVAAGIILIESGTVMLFLIGCEIYYGKTSFSTMSILGFVVNLILGIKFLHQGFDLLISWNAIRNHTRTLELNGRESERVRFNITPIKDRKPASAAAA